MFELQGIEKDEFTSYKNRALVRDGDEIIYGDPTAAAYVSMLIMSKREIAGAEVPDMVIVQLFHKGSDKIQQQFISKGLNDALDTADVWLKNLKL